MGDLTEIKVPIKLLQVIKRSHKATVFSLLCIVFFIITAALSVHNKSSTWDDPYHLTGGAAQWQTGEPRLNADHPPLARLLGALPAVFMDVPSVADIAPDAWKKADLISATNAYFDIDEERLLWPGRLAMLSFAALLGCLLHAWGRELFGAARAWLPLALFAFCPPLLANAPLVTTDLAATTLMFGALYTWWRYLRVPSLQRLVWVCIAVAAAFSAKYTAVLLVPLFLLSGGIAIAAPTVLQFDFKHRLQIVGGGLLAIGIATIFGINLMYFFDGVFLTPSEYQSYSRQLIPSLQIGAEQISHYWPAWLPVPLPFYYVSGLLSVLVNVGKHGHWTYFLGEAGVGGWPNYFLMLLLVKLPIPTLILICIGFFQAASRFKRDWWNVLFLVFPPLLLIWTASNGKMQIGIRHILPALPFLFLLAGYNLRYRLNRWRTIFAVTMIALSAIATLSMHPFYLMYFNFLAGGPEQGWRISITGDDYGQGDADLLRWLQARGIKELAYGPFGWGGVILNSAGISMKPLSCSDTGELVAVHAGHLLITSTPLENNRCFAWMRLREPDEKIGYSIFIYNSKNLVNSAAKKYLDESAGLYSAGDYNKSIEAGMKALQLKPDYADAYNNICAAYNKLENWDESIKACSKAIELKPDFELAKNNLAWAKKWLQKARY